MNSLAAHIAENVDRVRGRIADAAARAGRDADDVTLVAVTKYVGPRETAALVEARCRDLGESRPQQLWQKADSLELLPIRWHLIGHLQRNKVRRTVPLLTLLQSVDSRRLAAAVEESAAAQDRTVPVLLEVNVSGESAKHGFSPEDVPRLLDDWGRFPHLQLRGLMGMARRLGDNETARGDFVRLRELRDRLVANCPDDAALADLSMGMSGDFEVAVEEGATIVRVGSILFEGIDV